VEKKFRRKQRNAGSCGDGFTQSAPAAKDHADRRIAGINCSIRENGVLQPLIVTVGETDGQFILIAGERRLQAARLAGLSSVPVLVHQATDQQRLELAIIENVQRSDLSALERLRPTASCRGF